ncbi:MULTISPECIES: non-homologous end-joining DNA ligase [Brucella/Ochrobactrum group]|uniref:non-homologous end-joining DNA ligase n=1 Tax=unclassified Ochrobactrum TaxID=239106 RepID=UPI00111CC267|nr:MULTISPECIES: non-homologous end-joining DNA ligase [Brucella/Ochrobactrum group]MCQ9147631.1 non-homologous end-joining DNA ligase [Ochrobactrum sp. BTU2]
MARSIKSSQTVFDPMPERIEPCLALLVPRPPKGPDWGFEVKWDGYRLAIHVEPNRLRVLTRGGHDWTPRFNHIAQAALDLGHASMILDGEAVVLDDSGRSDFGALQRALGGRGGKRFAAESLFYVFDLLYLDGRDLTGMPLRERRAKLASLLSARPSPVIRFSETMEADGEAFFKIACAHDLEGIIAKRLDSPYRPGRHGEWQKIKCIQSDSFVIVGFEPSTTMRGAISRLLLGARKGKSLVYVGGVGTGFSHKMARDLKMRLEAIPVTKPPVALKRKNAVFARPEYIAEIEYRAWTDDGKLRHASFKGLREAADNADIFEIKGDT